MEGGEEMQDRPQLKSVTVHSSEGQLILWQRALKRIYIEDSSGSIAAMLQILAAGEYRVPELRQAMAGRGFTVSAEEVAAVLSALDDLGVLDEADGDDVLDDATRERHQSNLRFYDLFSRLGRTSASFHRSAEQSRVLLLGAGGLGSGILQSLVGLGVGEVTIVDIDTVETRNLARQFVYGLDAVGRPKVTAAHDWAASYSPGTRVLPVHQRVTDAATVAALGAGADVVICAIDSPDDIHLIVNEACFALGVPFVAGGLSYSTLSYWSVDPGRTPCRLCLERHHDDEARTLPPILRQAPLIEPGPVNRATGPVVQLISGLMSMEVMRYLTRTDPPVAAATYQVIELADQMEMTRTPWRRHPACPLCPTANPAASGQAVFAQAAFADAAGADP
jgi:molybdopterin/thiamine biosynthesis adenylyltransferase